MPYNEKLDPDQQITAEEAIAGALFDFEYPDEAQRPSEETCAELGRVILRQVLETFRPDLVSQDDTSELTPEIRAAILKLYARAEADEEALDDDVHDAFSNDAANVNNDGFVAQIAYLMNLTGPQVQAVVGEVAPGS